MAAAAKSFESSFNFWTDLTRLSSSSQAYYLDVDDRGFSSQFSRAAFIENIAIKVGRISGCDREKLDRHIIEWLYPMFRCRSFFGRYESIYNLNGASILPFFDVDVGSFGAGLPISGNVAGALRPS